MVLGKKRRVLLRRAMRRRSMDVAAT